MSRREDAFKYFNEQQEFMNERVNSGIELYRKGYAQLRFIDKNGNETKDIAFKLEQKSHDFNFGCNMFLLDEFETEEKNKIFRETFKKVFNYAIVPFYWCDLEPEKGKPRYDKNSPKIYRRPAPDLVLEYCKENNIRAKGHCLVYDKYNPSWMPEDILSIKSEIKNHLEEVSDRYKNDISDWDIINESLCWDMYNPNLTGKFFREEDYINYSFKTASRLPFKRKFINEAAGIWEGRLTRSPYYMQLKNLTYENVDFDAIGMQFHQFIAREEEKESAKYRYNPLKLYDTLDTFGKFNKPMQISEITIDSYNGDSEDMDIQAELVKNLYKIWFSHKNTDGIVYWNLVDGYTYVPESENKNGGALNMNIGENQYGGALLYNDLSPKPAFKTLQNLINKEWHTSGMYHTNTESGTAMVKGFKGMYEVTAEYEGKTYKSEFHLDGRSDYVNKIILD